MILGNILKTRAPRLSKEAHTTSSPNETESEGGTGDARENEKHGGKNKR
jgi:hypothetical protein